MNYIVEIPKQWRMGLSQSRLWHLNLVNSASGIEKLSIWPIVPQELKNSQSLHSFKKSTRKVKPKCPCRLCKTYLQHVGFI